jgi:hypothetical protein
VWVVAIDGKRVVIEAEVKQPESSNPPLGLNERPTRADVRRFRRGGGPDHRFDSLRLAGGALRREVALVGERNLP